MSWTQQIYLTAGLAALLLGGGVLLREPGRARNRHFALLCGAIAVWTLGRFGLLASDDPDFPWTQVFLLGSCLAPPLGLHFSLVVTRTSGPLRRVALPVAYLAALALWISAWTPARDAGRQWNLLALTVLGSILLLALAVFFLHYHALPLGPERKAHRLLFIGGLVAAAGGMSDFLPRELVGMPKIGPAAILVFLVIVCAVIVRHRFLDVHTFLTRAVLLVAGAAAAALLIFGVARLSGARFFPIFVATLLVLAVAGPLGRLVLSGARSLLTPQDPLAHALLEVSQTLPEVADTKGVWKAIKQGHDSLPDEVHLEVSLLEQGRDEYHVRFRAGPGAESRPVPVHAALPRLLSMERLPLSQRFLEREAQEAHGPSRKLAVEALGELQAIDTQLTVPLLSRDRLTGWISIGGGLPDRYMTAEVAAAFLAVGNHAVASLERIEAVERAKQREALAAVGEMAAGLAHEVRNPVAAIRGAAQAISPMATPEQSREMLDVISEETERLGRVVGEFLDYARPVSPRREPVAVKETVCVVLRSAELAGRGLSAEVRAPPGTPPALGDPDQIRRAFENLVRNAWEAAGPEGSLRVDIAPEDGQRVVVRFEDNGPGIPDDQIPRLFQPFRTSRAGGTGLGLALVHRIVEAHGGEIRVEGRPGRGAAFTLVLPCVPDG